MVFFSWTKKYKQVPKRHNVLQNCTLYSGYTHVMKFWLIARHNVSRSRRFAPLSPGSLWIILQKALVLPSRIACIFPSKSRKSMISMMKTPRNQARNAWSSHTSKVPWKHDDSEQLLGKIDGIRHRNTYVSCTFCGALSGGDEYYASNPREGVPITHDQRSREP